MTSSCRGRTARLFIINARQTFAVVRLSAFHCRRVFQRLVFLWLCAELDLHCWLVTIKPVLYLKPLDHVTPAVEQLLWLPIAERNHCRPTNCTSSEQVTSQSRSMLHLKPIEIQCRVRTLWPTLKVSLAALFLLYLFADYFISPV